MDHYHEVLVGKKFLLKKQQILIQNTYQLIDVVNGVSHSHKTANKFHLTQ